MKLAYRYSFFQIYALNCKYLLKFMQLNNKYDLFECKYSYNKTINVPKDFQNNYSNFQFNIISKENYWKYLIEP